MKKAFLISLLLAAGLTALADTIAVRIYSNVSITSLNISFDLGHYNLYGDEDETIERDLGNGHAIAVKSDGKQLTLNVDGHNEGTFKSLRLTALDSANILCLNPSNSKQRTYEGSLRIMSQKGKMVLVNEIEFESYLAGVVQSEIYGNESDIYRVQAIISRTWAMRNIGKHAAEGYNFCDHVHCQAYHNRCIRPEIMLGVLASRGETIVDQAGELIETPFHSNSGGETCNSEDVWKNALPYLRSVRDTFSLSMKQATWTKKMKADKWLSYFAKNHKINTGDPALRDSLLHFAQSHRRAKILGVPLTKVRLDLGLKSTFFNVDYNKGKNEVTLYGRGYGHGVGLSQEGAIRMVRLGISYDSIIRFYYSGATIHNGNSAEETIESEELVRQINTIIEDVKQGATANEEKDDWLGRLFLIHEDEEREEIYDEDEDDIEGDWEYEW